MKSFFKQYLTGPWQEIINKNKTELHFKKNEAIFEMGQKVEGLFEIKKGKAKVVRNTNEGQEVLIRLAGDNAILGHRGLGGDWIYPVSAIALEDTTVCFIPKETFELVARTNSEYSYHLMMFFSEELKSAEDKNHQQPVVNRMAKAIWKNCEAFGSDKKTGRLNFTIRRQDFANMVGTTYESVIRSIAELKKNGVIDTDNKAIIIKNLNGLKELAFKTK